MLIQRTLLAARYENPICGSARTNRATPCPPVCSPAMQRSIGRRYRSLSQTLRTTCRPQSKEGLAADRDASDSTLPTYH